MTLTKTQIEDALWRACFDSLSGSRNTIRHLGFEVSMEESISKAATELYDRTYRLQPARVSMIHYPVKREVFTPAVIDSFVSHMLYMMLYPMYEQLFDDDCYSCRIGKGTLYGINRLEHHLLSVSENWTKPCFVYLYDIAGYFISINHEVLYGFLEEDLDKLRGRRVPGDLFVRGIVSRSEWKQIAGKRWSEVRDIDFILWLSSLFVFRKATDNVIFLSPKSEWDDYPYWKSMFNASEGEGIIIGDVSNQLFSNVNGLRIDRYFRYTLHARHKGRYVDDGYNVGRDEKQLEDAGASFKEFLESGLKQRLHPDKIQIVNAHEGVDYLGARILPFRRYVSERTKKQFFRTLEQVNKRLEDDFSPEAVLEGSIRISSVLGHLKPFKTYNIRKCVLDYPEINRALAFDEAFTKASPKLNFEYKNSIALSA